jgi:hypothetical protein
LDFRTDPSPLPSLAADQFDLSFLGVASALPSHRPAPPQTAAVYDGDRGDFHQSPVGLWGTIGIVVFEKPGATGAIHLHQMAGEVLIGFQHTFTVGILSVSA